MKTLRDRRTWMTIGLIALVSALDLVWNFYFVRVYLVGATTYDAMCCRVPDFGFLGTVIVGPALEEAFWRGLMIIPFVAAYFRGSKLIKALFWAWIILTSGFGFGYLTHGGWPGFITAGLPSIMYAWLFVRVFRIYTHPPVFGLEEDRRDQRRRAWGIALFSAVLVHAIYNAADMAYRITICANQNFNFLEPF